VRALKNKWLPFNSHADQLNTPGTITNQAQQLVWRWENQEPFGNSPPEENPSGVGSFEFPLRFLGQHFDRETNTSYNYFRDYDPQSGRYLQSDPIGLAGGINTYLYVSGKPLSYLDPLGLEVEVGIRKFYPYPVPYARHCFVRFNGNSRDTLSFTKEGVVPDANPGSASYSPTRGRENDACVRQEMQKCRREDYNFTEFNCCMCASNALDACGLQKVGPWPNAPRDASNPPYPKAPPTMPPIVAP
jgi:RHS repeat-associated protein